MLRLATRAILPLLDREIAQTSGSGVKVATIIAGLGRQQHRLGYLCDVLTTRENSAVIMDLGNLFQCSLETPTMEALDNLDMILEPAYLAQRSVWTNKVKRNLVSPNVTGRVVIDSAFFTSSANEFAAGLSQFYIWRTGRYM